MPRQSKKTVFEKKSYWLGDGRVVVRSGPGVDAMGPAPEPASGARQAAGEPMIQEYHFGEPLLADHRIYGEQILMGVAHLSLAIDYARQVLGERSVGLERVGFSNAMVVKPAQRNAVTASHRRLGEKLHIQTHYDVPGGSRQAVDAVLRAGDSGPDKGRRLDVNAALGRATEEIRPAIFYHHPRQETYGPSLESVRRIHRLADGEVLGEVQLTEVMRDELSGYHVHPCVLDACHVVSTFALGGEPIDEHRVPLLVKAVWVSGAVAEDALSDCLCHATRVLENDQIAEIDIRLFDRRGDLLLALDGFTTKTVPSKQALLDGGGQKASARPDVAEVAEVTRDASAGDEPDSGEGAVNLEKAIQTYIREKIARISNQSASKVPLRKSFMDLGLESNSMIGLVSEVEKEVGIELYPTLLFEHQSIISLAGYFAESNERAFSAFLERSGRLDISGQPAVATGGQTIAADSGAHIAAAAEPARSEGRSPAARDVAIVGMSGYLPQSENLSEFWRHLERGDDLIEEIPRSRWDHRPWFDSDRATVNKSYSKWGGFLREVDKFDPVFFGVSPRLADWIDPQLRLLLQSVQATLEDAGAVCRTIGSKTGVYVGCCFQEYWDEIVRARTPMVDYQAHSAAMSSLSGTVSYTFDLQGGSIPLDNACASSLTALHLACQALYGGECEQAIVAGVNVLLSPLHYVYFSRLQALSPSGRCYSFDKKANGYVPGEGVVSILVKPLDAALRDEDPIYAVIKGTAINHVGRSNNPYAPRPESQTKLLREAWINAGIDPAELGYIEAHGTGTELGDPIEINALKAAIRPFNARPGSCAVGSTKAHAGHLEGAAGLTSLIKVVLMMRHRQIPRMPNFEELNPYIKLDDSPFFINRELMDWERRDGRPLLAGISSFGMTGNNAHVVVEEYAPPMRAARAAPADVKKTPALVPLSAKDDERLGVYARRFATFLSHERADRDEPPRLDDIAYTLQVGRQPMPCRVVFVVRELDELVEKLTRFADGASGPDDCSQGHAEDEVDVEQYFASEAELTRTVTRWAEAGELARIAELWLKGFELDWNALPTRGSARRIPLPTYPFAKGRYWMSETPSAPPAAPPAARGANRGPALHPMVHENVSDLDGLCFRSVFTGEEFFLRDHRVLDTRVLPGVAYLEMARTAAAIVSRRDVQTLSNIVWVRPIEVREDPAEVTIRLLTDSDEIAYEVTTGQGADRSVHARGKAIRGARSVAGQRTVDIAAARQRCSQTIERAEIYQHFARQGLHYGAAFQSIERIHCSPDEAVAVLRRPAVRDDSGDPYGLDPSVMDAALQACIGLWLGRGASDGPARLQLPFAVGSIVIHGEVPRDGYAHVRHSAGTNPGGAVLEHDIDLIDLDGEVCVEFIKFATRVVEPPRTRARDIPERGSSAPVVEARPDPGAARLEAGELDERGPERRLGEAIAQFLVCSICDILRLKPEDITLEEEMSAFGTDSITLTEFSNRTSREFDIEVAPTVFFECPTLASFRDYLLAHHRDALEAAFPDRSSQSRGDRAEETSAAVEPVPGNSPQALSSSSARVEDRRGSEDDIAIVGVSGRFPMAADVEAFWANLRDGRDCISEVPTDRWDWRAIYGDPRRERNKSNVKWGGFMDDVDKFDPLFFGISPREAELMDPQQRLLMSYVWLAIEDAGHAPRSLSGSSTGIFVGTAGTGYGDRVLRWSDLEGMTSTAVVPSAGPNRISFLLNIHGPSEPIETACSSALVALHRAVRAIRDGECDQALAGGVNTLLAPEVHIAFNKAGMLCEDGRCKTFSKDANGYVRGEGVGVLFLKRLRDAERERDHIHAVIKASAVNHGGRAHSLTAPNVNAQAEVLATAYRQSGIDPSTVTYIETHGTGTALGDPVEINGLQKAFAALHDERGVEWIPGRCGLGSVKSNIGHLELAAGIAGMMKVLLAMKHGELPASLHCDEVNPYIELDGSPFYLVDRRRPWHRLEDANGAVIPRRAGVSSFGFGGVNAHVVLEEYIPSSESRPARSSLAGARPAVVVLSARTKDRLRAYAESLRAFVATTEVWLEDLAYTLQVGRDPMECRLAFVARDLDDLRGALAAFLAGRVSERWYTGHRVASYQAAPAALDASQIDAHRLAERWANGEDVVWEALYGDDRPRRVSLPTYPFARERYWIPRPESIGSAEGTRSDRSFDHRVASAQVSERRDRPRIDRDAVWESDERERGVVYATRRWREERQEESVEEAERRGSRHVMLVGGREAQRARVAEVTGAAVEVVATEGLEGRPVVRFEAVLERVKGLMGSEGAGSRLLVVVDRDAALESAPLAGLMRTARAENPGFAGKVVQVPGLSTGDAEGLAVWLDGEMDRGWDGVEVRYQEDGTRERRELVELETPMEEAGVEVRRGGVYWITGGLGGLGQVFARRLLERDDVTVVLSGRSEEPLDKERREALQALGEGAVYLSVDITDRAAVERAVETMKRRWGELRGVIHSAGVLRDAYILKKEAGQSREVFGPKVDGLENIDAATRTEALDFMVLFSSLAGVLGSAGQADYAGANAYVDEFARWREEEVKRGRRSGVTRAIAWPLWRAGGMGVSRQSEEMMTRVSGLVAMETETGLGAFDAAMASPHASFIVMPGYVEKIRQKFAPRAINDRRPESGMGQPDPGKSIPDSLLQARTAQYLKRDLAKALKMPGDRIDEEAPLEKYGISSLMVLELTDELEKVFGPLSKTLFFEHQTLTAVASHLVANHRERLLKLLGLDEPVGSETRRGRHAPRRGPAPRVVGHAPSHRPQRAPERSRGDSGGSADIAIIGLSGRYPQGRDVAGLWQNLRAGRDCITEIPSERWDYREYYTEDTGEEGKIYSKWGGFIDGVDTFDPLFFNISPREAEVMDPQERLFLECAWHALEDAGYTRGRLREGGVAGQVGVYVGVMYEEYQLLGVEEQVAGRVMALTGNPAGIANRVSYFCDLEGPSMAVDTMCSSSLTTVHLACQSLRAGQCRMAIAGGVNVSVHPNKYILLSQGRFVSTRGRCESFGRGGDGYVPGEGVGSVVLKALEEAERDGDTIYGVIKGSALNHGGKTNGYTVPNPRAQTGVVRAALEDAGVSPDAISYVEAHGTGTSLGDPIEIAALSKAYEGREGERCAIGSIKSNIGHCESAAGIAGLTKVLLQFAHGQLVPSLHAEELNPHIDFESTPFRVQRELQEWKRPVVGGRERSRMAAISSFGAGGSNAHVIVEEYVRSAPERGEDGEERDIGPRLFVLSARTPERLRVYARAMLAFIRDADCRWIDFLHTLQVGREAMEHRLAIRVRDRAALCSRLTAFLAGDRGIDGLYLGDATERDATVRALGGDADFQDLVRVWASKGKLDNLAEFWVKGGRFDWTLLHGEEQPRRLSLPTYPFAEERCWVPRADDLPIAANRRRALHPMVEENISDLWELKFRTVFTGREFFLDGHRVGGEKILPAAGHLEMVRAAGELASNHDVMRLEDVVWIRPVVVNGEARGLTIRLDPQAENTVGFEVWSDEESLHSQGRFTLDSRREGDSPRLDVEAILRRCDGRLSSEDLYDSLVARGLDHGAEMRAMGDIRFTHDEVMARIEVPNGTHEQAQRYVLHPSAIDAALQTIAVMEMDGGSGRFVPYAAKGVTIHGSTPTRGYAHTRRRGDHDSAAYDIELVNDDGDVCVALEAVTLRRFDAEHDEGSAGGVVYATRRWREERQEESVEEAGRSGSRHVMLVGGREAQRARVAEVTGAAVEMVAAAGLEGRPLVRFEAVLERVKGLMGSEGAGSRLVVVVDRDAALESAPLAGLLRTARAENPGFAGKVVQVPGLSTGDAEGLAVWLDGEMERGWDGVEVRYQEDGRRERRELVELERPMEEAGVEVRRGGVYWITGGLGGLGQVFARRLLEREDVRVVLSGRSGEPLDEERREALQALGEGAVYLSVDITDRAAVERAVETMKRRWGELRGVIHSAGVLRDAYILKKEAGQSREVFGPKVDGLENIDAATRTEALDFMVLFSSLAGVLGSAGQADYAGANAYVDEFARWREEEVKRGRRSGVTRAIAWPLWRAGGMGVSRQSEEMMTRVSGLVAMDTETGLRAFDAAMASPHASFIVMPGYVEKIRQTLLRRPIADDARSVASVAEPVGGTASDGGAGRDDDLLEEFIEFLQLRLSRVLKLSVDRVNARAPLENYGIDSVMVLELTNELEKIFGPLSKTLFFEYQTLEAVALYFVANHRDRLLELVSLDDGASVEVQSRETRGGGVSAARVMRRSPSPWMRSGKERSRRDSGGSGGSVDIAIIGLSGRYPQGRDVAGLWQNLRAGRDCITEIPSERWDYREYYTEDTGEEGKIYSKWGGFIDGVDTFDPLFFNISPREAEVMDPQERLFLECAWHALEDAGYTRARLREGGVAGQVGVYVGVMYEEYQLLGVEEQVAGRVMALTGNPAGIANRVSYFCDLEGPSMAVDTMCSSSLTTVHLACQSLRAGQCRMAIAGGVNVSVHPNKYILLSQGRFVSTRGRCESFGRGGDGYVPGEGVGSVVLKALDEAERDGDTIYGVIKGSALNHGGKTNGYTVPNPRAQTGVVRAALEDAGVSPDAISYVEAHGTGTSLGDPIEIAALSKAYEGRGGERCAIGSIKSNIGHCESAAGIAGLTKVLLQFAHGELVPSLHAEELNPHIDFESTPFRVQRELQEWKRLVVGGREQPRMAAISSFGAGGSNAHVIVEEYVRSAPERGGDGEERDVGPQLFVLSARTPERLRAYADVWLEFFARERMDRAGSTPVEATRFADIAYTLQVGREAMKHRLAIIARGPAAVSDILTAFMDGDTAGAFIGQVDPGDAIDALGSDAELRSAFQKWAEKGKLAKLARLWVRGLAVDWERLHAGAHRRRLSLPTYPFAEGRFWVPEAADETPATGVGAGPGAPTPALTTPPESPAGPRANASGDGDDRNRALAQVWTQVWTDDPRPVAGIDWLHQLRRRRGERILIVHEATVDPSGPREVVRELEGLLRESEELCPFSASWLALADGLVQQWSAHGSSVSGVARDSGPCSLDTLFADLHRDGELPDVVFCHGVSTFLPVATGLLRAAWARPIRGWIIHSSAPAPTALAGLTDIVLAENPAHVYTPIGVDGDPGEAAWISLALREWLLADDRSVPQRLRYTAGRRQRSDLQPAPDAPGVSRLRREGTYLVSNAGSDLGRSLVRHLKDEYDAAVIALDHADHSWDEAVADISDSRALAQAIERARKAGTGAIDGVFHLVDDTDRSAEARAACLMTKEWRAKPLSSRAAEWQARGAVVVLVNAETAAWAEQAASELDVSEVVVWSSEDVAGSTRWVDLDDLEAAPRWVDEFMGEHPEVALVVDLSDLFTRSRSKTREPWGKIHLLQRLIGRFSELAILHFTRGLVRFRDESMSLAGAKFAGLVKMLSAEYNHVTARCIDVDGGGCVAADIWDVVRQELASPLEETEIVYRDGARFAPFLTTRDLPAPRRASDDSPFPVRRDGVYVITGGTSGIGLEIARYLSSCGATRLLLMGITPLPPAQEWSVAARQSSAPASTRAKIAALLELERRGVTVEVHIGALDDRVRLTEVFAGVRERLGPIRGVVHSAGAMTPMSTDEFAFIRKPLDRMAAVLAPKVAGIDTLSDALSADPLDFFVSFSSTAGQIPAFMRGMSDYGLANAYLDTFSEYQAGQGKPHFRSLGWIGWSDTGSHTRESAVRELAEKNAGRYGLLFNGTPDGLALFDGAMAGTRSRGGSALPGFVDRATFDLAAETILFARPQDVDSNASAASAAIAHLEASRALAQQTASALANVDDGSRHEQLSCFVIASMASCPGHGVLDPACQTFAEWRSQAANAGSRHGATIHVSLPAGRSAADSVRQLIRGADAPVHAVIMETDMEPSGASAAPPVVQARAQREGADSAFARALAMLRAGRDIDDVLVDVDIERLTDSQVHELSTFVFEPSGADEPGVAMDDPSPPKPVEPLSRPSVHSERPVDPPASSEQEIRALIIHELASILKLDRAVINDHESFQDYGLDSITGTQLATRVEQTLEIDVSPAWLIEFPTVAGLARTIHRAIQDITDGAR